MYFGHIHERKRSSSQKRDDILHDVCKIATSRGKEGPEKCDKGSISLDLFVVRMSLFETPCASCFPFWPATFSAEILGDGEKGN